MARTGRPKAELILSGEERETLERWTRRATSAQALAMRSRMILECADGLGNQEAAAKLHCHHATVGKWRSRFIGMRLDGLCDEPRSGRKPTIADEMVEKVVVDTLESSPADATHWSRASMAKHTGLSPSTIGRIWKAFQLKPHLADTFKISADPLFVEKVHDIVGLYLNPPEHAVVLCVDEKSQVQALDRSQPVLPMMPGMPERRTHDYARYGTLDLFAAFNVADGLVIADTCKQHRHVEWIRFLAKIDKQVPRLTDQGEALQIHIIADNYATHKTPEVQVWLDKHPRIHMHFTPTSSSWINQVDYADTAVMPTWCPVPLLARGASGSDIGIISGLPGRPGPCRVAASARRDAVQHPACQGKRASEPGQACGHGTAGGSPGHPDYAGSVSTLDRA